MKENGSKNVFILSNMYLLFIERVCSLRSFLLKELPHIEGGRKHNTLEFALKSNNHGNRIFAVEAKVSLPNRKCIGITTLDWS